MKRKQKITDEMIIAAYKRDDGTGFCVVCGAEVYEIEPDAQEYECECCGEHGVYGAEELLGLRMAALIV